MLLLFALASVALLGMIGLLVSAGLLLQQRRILQDAADSAALVASWRLADQLASQSLQNAPVQAAVSSFTTQNGVPTDGTSANRTYVTSLYLDSGGTSLGVGPADGTTLPVAALGVQVQAQSNSTTFLPFFSRISSLQPRASANAALVPAPYPALYSGVIPVAVPLTAYQSTQAYDLLSTFYANRDYGVSGYIATADLASGSNSGTNYQAAPTWGTAEPNVQYWATGAFAGGRLGMSNQLALFSSTYGSYLAAGLRDNVRRQGLVDAAGEAYALVYVPLWDSYTAGTPATVRIAGFGAFKLRQRDIQSTSLSGVFVPYVVGAYGTSTSGTPSWGPKYILLTG